MVVRFLSEADERPSIGAGQLSTGCEQRAGQEALEDLGLVASAPAGEVVVGASGVSELTGRFSTVVALPATPGAGSVRA